MIHLVLVCSHYSRSQQARGEIERLHPLLLYRLLLFLGRCQFSVRLSYHMSKGFFSFPICPCGGADLKKDAGSAERISADPASFFFGVGRLCKHWNRNKQKRKKRYANKLCNMSKEGI